MNWDIASTLILLAVISTFVYIGYDIMRRKI
uniref:Uncharacterized protein n=1 Tax=Candidatus Kentrum sp. FM TaxID=2126340 RepID=A0A450WA47_9GAMM|nr:MAG: hypothetical protein BECKFM1743C_GA0114222_102685 [Candidatus Kentron sp. FM]VFJ62363.1 MAG: hypothetical protein BECKFM1743A_GA0114220_103053 [Candidatus Kentron sp. FM]VFK13923.1 MAG: hypothetical protein BECKFM1743B_GA0114221_102994 [Candidatus Kentron sp. FM]